MSQRSESSIGVLNKGHDNAVEDAHLTKQRRFDFLVGAAFALHSNGEASEETVSLIDELSKALDIPTTIFLRWDEIVLQPSPAGVDCCSFAVPAVAAAVSMSRVQAVSSIIVRVCNGSLSLIAAESAMDAAKKSTPSTLPLFVSACIAAACALAILSGARYPQALGFIAVSAGIGALVRRSLGSRGLGAIAQSFAAATLAGLVASIAVHAHVNNVLRILAVTPCMILVPGPHLINGSVDMLALRLSLGLARLSYAIWILGAICAGMLIGLQLGGISLPASEVTPGIPLWIDVLCAGVAAASYGIFFSMPLRMLLWPILAGMIAHAAHWWFSAAFHASAATAAGIAGLIVGILLTPVSQRMRLPFAAIGFASVVSLMPGTLVFRMSSGFLQLAEHTKDVTLASVTNTLSDGVTAVLVVLALVLGLSLPQHFFRLFQKANRDLVL